jgi:hypothetical protein
MPAAPRARADFRPTRAPVVHHGLIPPGEGGPARRAPAIPHRRRRPDLEHRHPKLPEATQIVDLFHAREHLHDLARRLEFMLLDRRDEWLATRLEDLDYGYIDGIVTATRKYPLEGVKKDEIDTDAGYFEVELPRLSLRCRLCPSSTRTCQVSREFTTTS